MAITLQPCCSAYHDKPQSSTLSSQWFQFVFRLSVGWDRSQLLSLFASFQWDRSCLGENNNEGFQSGLLLVTEVNIHTESLHT